MVDIVDASGLNPVKIATIVGARPQFIKAAALSREIRKRHSELLVHTGQHYDDKMSRVFFDELEIPPPDVNLSVGSGSHGKQTGSMLTGIEDVLLHHQPDWVLVYGDTNSTLAGALAAAKLHIPVVHVEAGLRSFNRSMPEELNRVVTDHLATLLLCPSQAASDNLRVEGIQEGVHVVGDVMADTLLHVAEHAAQNSTIVEDLQLIAGDYWLVTVHRAENTDSPERLQSIVEALAELPGPVVFPIHPRTRRALGKFSSTLAHHIHVLEPVSYAAMVRLQKTARGILTDSGGIQKEAYWLGIPCITLRDETEWVETVETGWNIITGVDKSRILTAALNRCLPNFRPPLYGGDGHASERCLAVLETL